MMFQQSLVFGYKKVVNLDTTLDFDLPAKLEASEPPEARGLARDEVRLMVSYRSADRVLHTQFRNLTSILEAGDLLVINTSGTLNAALNATREDGTALELHLSTQLPPNLHIVELREPVGTTTKPFFGAKAGETLTLPAGATLTLHVPYSRNQATTGPKDANYQQEGSLPEKPDSLPGKSTGRSKEIPAYLSDALATVEKECDHSRNRLWIATLNIPGNVNYQILVDYLTQYGFPIRYSYVKQGWPASYYQTVYATEMGSAEMPSAGRAFTPELITQLVARGIQIAPLILHTGVASLENHEPPYEEYYRVPLQTAQQVNMAHEHGRRVIAVGTTVVRALETVTDVEGTTHPGEGWTRLVITPERGIRAVNALLTGLHEPQASHLAMLEALAGREHLRITYAEALREEYLWHEFGDLHLILP